MLGNLQVYLGPEKLDAYGKALHGLGPILWAVRLGLLAALVVHIVASIQVWKQSLHARPQAYVKKQDIAATYAARTMRWSGPILAAFIIYHLLHFTTGQAHPDFRYLGVYHNVVTGFQSVPASLFYILSMVLLGLHLNHGLWSMFQTMGVSHPRYTPFLKRFAQLFSAIIVIGNCSIPVSVLLGVIR
jgi:succinate dehydrogenase / fumarate reductase cytochrome b subunit